ncbi:thioredoxin family protein [Leptospira kanakyensis]|uniref:Thioredoxin family protein n=1 Tax=Leptospira kanakyensis TaxID=2484968 RepID=A0A6N4QB97_9LEPT|nr:thioredoxin family protein [Leptospira kanakyensis]MCW7480393.1 thioredoxin family protein [Leptospira kanakyensis]TGK50583.1 thioredoxin family protein [Leptospira kanakyensis]TGK63816.1 thioredoxin family protein [Leptospira kanakyensis]TGK69721.1 thioredoxin family protein [Leptospira kanakyensis]
MRKVPSAFFMESKFRFFFSLLLLGFSLTTLSYCSKQSDIILSQYQERLTEAKNLNRKLIVVFGADWCPDCRALDGIFQEPEPKALLSQNFIIFKVDVGRFDKNLSLNDTLGNPIQNGIPALVVIDPSGKILTSTKGGEFSNASKMTKEQVLEYLYRL